VQLAASSPSVRIRNVCVLADAAGWLRSRIAACIL
jgi:hypothetical protein